MELTSPFRTGLSPAGHVPLFLAHTYQVVYCRHQIFARLRLGPQIVIALNVYIWGTSANTLFKPHGYAWDIGGLLTPILLYVLNSPGKALLVHANTQRDHRIFHSAEWSRLEHGSSHAAGVSD